MPENFYMYFIAALLPMITGAVYYHPAVFGSAWMKINDFTEDSLKGSNMIVLFLLSYLFSLMIAVILGNLAIHQTQVFSLLVPEVMESGSAAQDQFNDFITRYGDRYRTFRHGALHGGVTAVFFVLPVVGTISLFERRGWRYTLVHFFYWFITLMLMGGLLCQTLKYNTVA
jgi:hypothetical protein